MNIVEHVEHAPNPQWMRDSWEDLTGTWAFAYDDRNVGLRERWFDRNHELTDTITVPFAPESPLSGIGDRSFHPVLWYQRRLPHSGAITHQRCHIVFGAVDYRFTLWVDGHFAGAHEGGSVPVQLDITDALEGTDDHVVTLRVEDDPHDLEQPRGKQDWEAEPHVIFYHRTSGIWQPVWLEPVPETFIEGITWSFDESNWTVAFDADLNAVPDPGATLTVSLHEDVNAVSSGTWTVGQRSVRGSLQIGQSLQRNARRSLLWSPDSPRLIGVTLRLDHADGHYDQVFTYIGLRTISTDGGHISINGRPVFLRFLLNQGYWPESMLTAPSPADLKRDITLMQELGFNGARTHQKIEDPRFLYWADRLGFLLWGEIGNAFVYSEQAIDRHLREWREAVVRDRNHPSVIAWVPFNESWGIDEVGLSTPQQEAVRAAYHTTHQLDGTRPVVGNDGWEHVVGDLLTIHDYSWDAVQLTERYGSDRTSEEIIEAYRAGHRHLVVSDENFADKPIVLTEFGGVSFAPDAGEEWFGYGKVVSSEAFLEKYRELVDAVSGSRRLAGFCYTQFTDTEQETNGLVRADRSPKVDIAELRRITSGKAD